MKAVSILSFQVTSILAILSASAAEAGVQKTRINNKNKMVTEIFIR